MNPNWFNTVHIIVSPTWKFLCFLHIIVGGKMGKVTSKSRIFIDKFCANTIFIIHIDIASQAELYNIHYDIFVSPCLRFINETQLVSLCCLIWTNLRLPFIYICCEYILSFETSRKCLYIWTHNSIILNRVLDNFLGR